MYFNNLLLHVPYLSRCLACVIGASDGGCIKGGSVLVRTSPDVPWSASRSRRAVLPGGHDVPSHAESGRRRHDPGCRIVVIARGGSDVVE